MLLVVETLAGMLRGNSTQAVHTGEDKWSDAEAVQRGMQKWMGIAALGAALAKTAQDSGQTDYQLKLLRKQIHT